MLHFNNICITLFHKSKIFKTFVNTILHKKNPLKNHCDEQRIQNNDYTKLYQIIKCSTSFMFFRFTEKKETRFFHVNTEVNAKENSRLLFTKLEDVFE